MPNIKRIILPACMLAVILFFGCRSSASENAQPEETSVSAAVTAETESPVLPEPKQTDTALRPLHVENGALVNEAGETVQLRGVSTHGLAWFPEYVNKDAFRTLRDEWNVNAIRLAMYTAENGGYCTGGNREELLSVIDRGVQYTEELGMYVIIDWHILSDQSPQQHEAEANAFFDELSKKYAGKPHVLYEICNEPQNSPYTAVIRPYAERIIDVIRGNNSNAVILVGTNTWAQDIDEVIGQRLDDPNVIYTVHFYAATHKDGLRRKVERALDAGIPVYISECSICDASGNGAIDYDSAEAWLALIRNRGLSFNAWSLCNKNEGSALIRPECRKLSGWNQEELSEAGIWFRNAFLSFDAQG